MSTTIQELRELAMTAQERDGCADAPVRLMMERWWPVEEEDPERVQLFKSTGPWGDVGFRWMRCVSVRFRADEVLEALDHLEAFTSSSPQVAAGEGQG